MLNKIQTNNRRVMDRGIVIRIKVGHEIGIYKSVLRALGCPNNIQFWWSGNNQTLLIGGTDENAAVSIPIPECYYSYMNGLKVSNKNLLRILQELLGWVNGTERKISGKFIPELNMVAFKTTNIKTEVINNACN